MLAMLMILDLKGLAIDSELLIAAILWLMPPSWRTLKH